MVALDPIDVVSDIPEVKSFDEILKAREARLKQASTDSTTPSNNGTSTTGT